MTPYFLVILGLLLILCEFYLPGAVLGTLGGIAILSGVILFASQTTSFFAIAFFIGGTAVAVALLVRFALWRIVHAKPENSIYSDDSQEGYQASSFDKSAIGKTGVVVSDLKPGGFISVEGHHHPAISLAGYISRGEGVKVVGGQEQSLLVNKIDLSRNC